MLFVLTVSLACALAVFGPELSPDQYLVVLVAPAAALSRVRRYLRDFVPLVALLIAYGACRGAAHVIHPHPYYRPQLRIEDLLFHGQLPTLALQHWLGTDPSSVAAETAKAIWLLHFHVPLLLAFLLWVARSALYVRYALSMVLLSFAAAATFALLPAAPPWAAAQRHLIGPLTHVTANTSARPTGSLLQNPYAAIPSLHVGYAVLASLFIVSATWRTRWRWFALVGATLYPLLQGLTVVYSGDHYVVDTIAGALFAVAAFAGVGRCLAWRSARGDHPAAVVRARPELADG